MRKQQSAVSRDQELHPLHAWQKTWVILSLIASPCLLIWRASSGLNEEHPIYSWLFLAVDFLGMLSIFHLFVSAYRLRKRESQPILTHRTVDVLIPTFNESTELLASTIHSCVQLDYPHETYVLDDGRRPEVEALAREMGVRYITRDNNAHAKAGNLNNAIPQTRGEIIAIIDADGIPRRDLLTKLLGYFEDPSVALVQTPQTFYNVDSFQHSNDVKKRKIWQEQSLFFDVLQCGRDYHEASMSCGSGSLMRRSALEAIGGVSLGTLTEDLHTSLSFHKNGFKSVYHSEPLAYCLAPATVTGYVTQRARWATGGVQLLRREFGALFGESRLTWAQRFLYLPVYYLSSMQRALYMIAPALFLAFGLTPVSDNEWSLAPIVAQMVLSIGSYYILARGTARIFLSETFYLYNLLSYLKAIVIGLSPIELKFRVTSKSIDANEGRLFITIPVAIVQVIASISFVMGVRRLSEYEDGSADSLSGLIFTLGCSAFYIATSTWAGLRSYKKAFWRESYSFFDARPIQVLSVNGAPTTGLNFGITTVISEKKVRFAQLHPMEPGTRVQVRLEIPGSQLDLDAEVLSCMKSDAAASHQLYQVELSYLNLSQENRIRLLECFFQCTTPRVLSAYAPQFPQERVRQAAHENRRQKSRHSAVIPALVTGRGYAAQHHPGVVADLSSSGARMHSKEHVAPGTRVQVHLPWSNKSLNARVVRCLKDVGRLGDIYELGLSFDSELDILPSLLSGGRLSEVALPA